MMHLISLTPRRTRIHVCMRAFLQLLIVAATFSSHKVFAGDVRGRVNATNAFAQYNYPLANTLVVLSRFGEASGKWIPVSQAYTNSFGEYFFRSMPPGRYQVEVDGQKYIFVVTSERFQDIAPILIRR